MLHKSTIKSEVRKQFTGIDIVEVKTHNWGLFNVKVKKEMARSTKIGMIWGETDFNKNTKNGVVLESKIEWL